MRTGPAIADDGSAYLIDQPKLAQSAAMVRPGPVGNPVNPPILPA